MFLIILNLICTCMLGLAPLREVPAQDQQASVQYVEEKSRDNYVSTGDYFFIMFNDFNSNQFGDGLFSNAITNLGTEFNNFPSSILYPTNVDDYIEVSIGDAVNGSVFGYLRQFDSNLKIITLNGYPVSQITFRKTYTWQYSNGSRLYSYDITLYSRQGSGQAIAILGFTYTLCTSLKYTSTGGNLVELGNYVVSITPRYITGSPITSSNASKYVYQEYLGDDYPHPLYSSYYQSLDTRIDIETAREEGYSVGWTNGRNSGYAEGRQVGYAEALQEASTHESTALTIFNGIISVGLLPVNVFLKMFEYEVFGINIAGLMSGLFTIAIVIIVIRLVTGKKND